MKPVWLVIAQTCPRQPKSEKESALGEVMDVLMSLYMSSVVFALICLYDLLHTGSDKLACPLGNSV